MDRCTERLLTATLFQAQQFQQSVCQVAGNPPGGLAHMLICPAFLKKIGMKTVDNTINFPALKMGL
ncbi:hypothetical protein SY86_12555 [Erwinia tracheiphila]|uniref:Uncharacterized protein n=1 Tax=Erwinia tracheiphila TaxID=65700 RepID=A0A0M2KFT0_9GAMM|nr:hypothetical protein [Erwinia tracheiphila]AXF77195.1 hypothetical protein AV903_16040 [Erwinia tracheiphila]KKF36063.1 hypothetical protein SY86_12555 [Erwinia tracheiphila]UIA84115.1 hypothetical protein LU604_03305 [Erwinia tracheiphila]UIA92696.1 hypothetical protein LU632_03270 [Erwinia tracheiphila]